MTGSVEIIPMVKLEWFGEQRTVTVEQARGLRDAINVALKLDPIKAAVCEEFGVSESDLVRNNQSPRVAIPRMVGMWLHRKLTSCSLDHIAEMYSSSDSRRHHTSVGSAVDRIDKILTNNDKRDEWIKASVLKLYNQLNNNRSK